MAKPKYLKKVKHRLTLLQEALPDHDAIMRMLAAKRRREGKEANHGADYNTATAIGILLERDIDALIKEATGA